MRVLSLHLYPIKGTRALDVSHAQLGLRGLEGDRRWVVVDAAGRFITQRSHPRLAMISAVPTASGLRLSAPGSDEIFVARPSGAERGEITVWQHRVNAALAGAQAGAWLSRFVGEALNLAYMDAAAERLQRGIWSDEAIPVSFADAYPVLVVTSGSLDAVNAEIERTGGAPVPMRRFRPNIVVDCDGAWSEDFWRVLRIGAVELDLVKPCDRCVVTTKDQTSGQAMGREPLASLARLRRSADPRINGVLFGWNAAPRTLGDIAVGDPVEILQPRPEGFPLRTGLAHGFEVEKFMP